MPREREKDREECLERAVPGEPGEKVREGNEWIERGSQNVVVELVSAIEKEEERPEDGGDRDRIRGPQQNLPVIQ